jgi:hypothetical protein
MAQAVSTAASVRPRAMSREGDLGWLVGAAAVMAILCAAPYVVAAIFGPPELERVGTFWFVRDFSQYQAAMREGAQSTSWLIHNRFSSEQHAAVLMYPLYVGAGKAAAALRIDPLVVFASLEWIGRASLLLTLYAFASVFAPGRSVRRLAVMLAAGTLGFGALLVPLRLIDSLAAVLPETIDIYLEINSFGLFFAAPHLMLGMALTLACGALYLGAIAGSRAWLAALAATVLSLSLVHPFNLPVLLSVLILHAALTGRRAWPAAMVAVATAAPMLIYSVAVFQLDPFWSGTYAAQNRMPAAPPWELVIDFGIVLLAAPLAWRFIRDWPAERRRLLLLWVGLGLVWMYLPVPYQRRLAFGVQPGLAVLAALGLTWLQTWLRTHEIDGLRRRLINDGIVTLALCTSVLAYVTLLASAARNEPVEVYLWSRAEADAARWLGNVVSDTDVVLASTEFANPLVGAIDGRVVHGHIVATFDSDTKQALVQRFFAADTPTAERSRILDRTSTTFVALGQRERALGVESLNSQPELALLYDRGGVQIFGVRR